jgi:proteasome lid subunit RPN8/RPN11/regulator of replication initiation timing
LSADDIQFDDVAYREPERLRRPDLDRDWVCIAYEVPGPDDMPIYLDRRPADAIERHALRDTSVELGGILLGKECIDEETGRPFVWITEAIEAKHYENTQASFTYTHDSWQEISRERDQKHPDLDIVGWYHTHPDFGIFLSSHDLFIHHHFFSQPLQVAYVVDPIRQTRGFFQWRDQEMEQVGGFHISAPRQDRQAVARFVNDLENIPNTDGGGSGLSPRLEAELIAMLSRPQYAPAAVDRTQTAAVFSLIGLLIGFLLVGAGLWLVTLSQALKDQTIAVKELGKSVESAARRQSNDVESERTAAKEQVLDVILREVRPGMSKESFTTAFAKMAQERDAARRELEKTATVNAAILEQGTQLRIERDKLQDRLKSEQTKRDNLEKDSKKTIADLETKLDKQASELELYNDSKTGRLVNRYNIAWYVAASALAGCVLLGLGVASLLGRTAPSESTPPSERPLTIS